MTKTTLRFTIEILVDVERTEEKEIKIIRMQNENKERNPVG